MNLSRKVVGNALFTVLKSGSEEKEKLEKIPGCSYIYYTRRGFPSQLTGPPVSAVNLSQPLQKMLSSPLEVTTPPDSAPPPEASAEKDTRRIQRISLPLPARVEAMINQKVSWNEITRLSDVSAFGAGFVLKRPLRRGRLVILTLPMPRQLRAYDFSDPQYRVWALVRRCITLATNRGEPEYAIGVAFAGKSPPIGYLEHPSMLYDISHREAGSTGLWHLMPANLMADESGLPKELQRQTRLSIPEPLHLEHLDATSNVIASETTVAENISLGGASVFTNMDVQAGTFLRVSSDRFNVTILSVARGVRVGSDSIKRLHLEVIDRFFPLDGVD